MSEEKEYKLSIGVAGNTAYPCMQAIKAKGYSMSLRYLLSHYSEGWRQEWIAEKDDRIFWADSSEELLGLIAMWEIRGDDWHINDGEYELYEQLRDSAIRYDKEGDIIEEDDN
jgi:hypothetical protein